MLYETYQTKCRNHHAEHGVRPGCTLQSHPSDQRHYIHDSEATGWGERQWMYVTVLPGTSTIIVSTLHGDKSIGHRPDDVTPRPLMQIFSSTRIQLLSSNLINTNNYLCLFVWPSALSHQSTKKPHNFQPSDTSYNQWHFQPLFPPSASARPSLTQFTAASSDWIPTTKLCLIQPSPRTRASIWTAMSCQGWTPSTPDATTRFRGWIPPTSFPTSA